VTDLVIIENGVPIPKFTKNYDEEKENITVFFLGSLSKQKGIFDLLAAIKDTHANVSLVIAGGASSSDISESIESKISDYALNERVQCVGSVVGDEKQRCFEMADIFVLPSYIEGLPISLLEAMCIGLPVITTPVGGIPSVIENNKTGLLVQPGDVQGLRDAIQTLADNPCLRRNLGSEAKKRCTQKHSIEMTAKKYLGLYNSIMKQVEN
jgi:glycosyltransferase involved in cell wall biosynthesis